MESEKKRAEAALTAFSGSLTDLESHLRPLLNSLDTLRSSPDAEMDALSRARLHITLSYATASLFCMYLRTQGMDPLTHPVAEEITRVQEAFMRLRKVEAGLPPDAQRMADRERRRWIQEVKLREAKLRAKIFPEEGELLKALLGKKEKGEEDGEMEYARIGAEELKDMAKQKEKKEKKERKKKEKKEKKEERKEEKLKVKREIAKEKKKKRKKARKEREREEKKAGKQDAT